jgi:hypothetical protein
MTSTPDATARSGTTEPTMETPSGAPSASSDPDLEALQAQIGDLMRRNQELEATQRPGHHWQGVLRAITAVVLVVLGAVFVTAAAPAIWSRNLVLNTDRYVETLSPLAADPGVQRAVVKAVDQQFNSRVDISRAVQEVLPPRAAGLLSGPLGSAASSLVNNIATRFVQSEAFARIWVTMNRVAHNALVAILTGKHVTKAAALTVKNGVLYLDLAPVVSEVKARLVSAGLTIAANVPTVGVTIKLLQVQGLTKAQSMVRLLDHAAVWLPLLGLLCFVGAILAAHRRRRAVMICALSTAGGMLVVAIGVLIGRQVYLDSLPLKYLTADDAGRVFDTLVRFLRQGIRIVFVVALLVCAITWATGGTRAARGLRAKAGHGGHAIRSQVTEWQQADVVIANKRTISISVAAVGALILVLWTNPSVLTVVLVALVTAGLVVLVYTAKPARTPTAVP